MKTYLECLPCFLRQALEACRFVTDDEAVHEAVMRETLLNVSKMDLSKTPPEMAYVIQRTIRRMTDNPDPYRHAKEASTRFALGLYPSLKARVDAADDPLEMATRFAVAGNVIDFGISAKMDEDYYMEIIERAARTPFDEAVFSEFRSKLQAARTILYLADNAGEVVFDRLLLDLLPHERIQYVVKSGPILNDATREDVTEAQMPASIHVIESGSDAQGTLLNHCSKEFVELFQQADLIIAKGQANFETLSGLPPRDLYFLLKVKCPMISRKLNAPMGDFIVRNLANMRKQEAE
ncbi:MAG: DUF89 family protein [Spartobacteria bacterium]|nr:DUF89 family protein [Spartobacteria bacterium]